MDRCLHAIVVLHCAMAASGVTMSNVDPWRTVDREIISAHAGGIYRFGGTYYLIGEHYQTCPHSGDSRVVDPLAVGNCEMCGQVNTTFAVYSSGDMEHWTLNTTDVIPDRPGGAAASLYTPVLAYNPAMQNPSVARLDTQSTLFTTVKFETTLSEVCADK